MKRALSTLSCALALLLSACGAGETALPTVATATPIPPPTDTPSPPPVRVTITPTPVGILGWRTVSGVVYADAAGPGHELAGAVVRCAQSSYSQVEGSCAPYEITTGPDGAFAFDVFVRDTDTIVLSAEREGYEPAELKVGGFDCVADCPSVDLVLVGPAADAQNIERVGRKEGIAGTVFVRSSEEVYVGMGSDLAILDPSDPTEPIQVGRIKLPGRINAIHVHRSFPDGGGRDLAYVAVEGEGLWIVDVNDPSSPKIVGSCDTPRQAHGVALAVYRWEDEEGERLERTYAYVAARGAGLSIIDVSDPANPVAVGAYEDLESPLAVAVADGLASTPDYLYVADWLGGLRILDLSDPTAPIEAASYETGWALDVVVSGGYAYVAAGRAGLKIVDVSNPGAPVEVAFDVFETLADPPPLTAVGTVAVKDGIWANAGQRYLYAGLGEEGVQALDVTDPTAPVAAGYYDAAVPVDDVGASRETVYLATEDGLLILQFNPSPTTTQFGSFTLNRLIYRRSPLHSLPTVQLPSWIELGEEEAGLLAQVQTAYEPLTHPSQEVRAVFREHYKDVISRVLDLLEQFPDGDGAIPTLMMLGNIHTYHGDLKWSYSSLSVGQEYERAIAFLLERHPERLPRILDDLVDLGLPIRQVASADLGTDGGEALLFGYQLSPPFGEPNGRVYGLVQEGDQPWVFAPLPTRYSDDCKHGAYVETTADINADGSNEVVVELCHAYAGGSGIRLHVFSWEGGTWVDRLSWNPLGCEDPSNSDAYYGRFWLEDWDGNGVQEIIVHHSSGYAPSLPWPYIYQVDIYQWDPQSRTYSDNLPITMQVCGYHAFAEGERLRRLGDIEEALPWYEEAQRRFLEELEMADSPCAEHLGEWHVRDLLATAQAYLEMEQ